jgi:hypothetical protein
MSESKVILVTDASTIVVPGSFTSGTNHFANAGHPADEAVAAAYEQRYGGLMDDVSRKLAGLAPEDADAGEVARQIARVIDTPKGKRPFPVYVDPSDDGAEDVFRVGDRSGSGSTSESGTRTCSA